jgi:predicted transcriptional regulator
MEELLAQPTRRRIFGVIRSHPGASAREVQRLAGLAWGETAYHLDQMTRAGALHRERGGRRDYYFTSDVTWDDRRLFRSLRSATQRRVLLCLIDTPGLTLGEIRLRAESSLSTVSFHVRHLLSVNAVEAVRDGNLRRYQVVDAARVRMYLERYRESFQDRFVDRFVETWSSLMR